MIRLLSIGAAIVLAVVTPAFAAGPLDCDPKFDLSHDNLIAGNEIVACLLHRTNADYDEYDNDFDGVLSPAENRARLEGDRKRSAYISALADVNALLAGKPGIVVQPQPRPKSPTATIERYKTQRGYFVRKAYEPVGVFVNLTHPSKKFPAPTFRSWTTLPRASPSSAPPAPLKPFGSGR